MQEISGRQEDILFDLEQIKLMSQEKDTLTDSEKEAMKELSPKKRKAEKEATLKEKETRRKEAIRIWTLEVEEKVHHSDLPPEIKAQILEMTAYIKERNMTVMYNVEQKIETLQNQIREAEERKEQKKRDEMADKILNVAAGAVVGAVAMATVAEIGIEAYKEAHPEWYHVQYTPEKLEQASRDYFDHSIVQKMAEMKLPVEAEKTYPKKQGSQYSKEQITATENKEKDVMEFAYHRALQTATKAGKKAPTKEDFAKLWKKAPAVWKRAAQKTLTAENPKLVAKWLEAEKKADAKAIQKGIERHRRKQAKKEAKQMKGLSKRLAAAQQGNKRGNKKTNHQILQAHSTQTVKSEERVRETAQAMPKKTAHKVFKVDFTQIAKEKQYRKAG